MKINESPHSETIYWMMVIYWCLEHTSKQVLPKDYKPYLIAFSIQYFVVAAVPSNALGSLGSWRCWNEQSDAWGYKADVRKSGRVLQEETRWAERRRRETDDHRGKHPSLSACGSSSVSAAAPSFDGWLPTLWQMQISLSQNFTTSSNSQGPLLIWF